MFMDQRGLTPSWARPQSDALSSQSGGDSRVGDPVVGSDPPQEFPGGMVHGCFADLLIFEALAAEGDALLAQDCGNTGLRYAVASANLPRRVSLVAPRQPPRS